MVVGTKQTTRRRRRRRRVVVQIAGTHLAVLASAYVTAIASGSRPHPWLGLLCLLPLLRAIQVLRPWQACAAGAAWGAWLFVFVAGADGGPLAPGAESLILLMAIPAAYAGAGSWVTRRVGFSPFVLGVAWMLVELALRPVAFRRGILAGALGDGLVISSVGRALGYVLVAFVVAFASAWLLALLTRVHLRLDRQANLIGPCEVLWLLWHVIPATRFFGIVRPGHPRAPPRATPQPVVGFTR